MFFVCFSKGVRPIAAGDKVQVLGFARVQSGKNRGLARISYWPRGQASVARGIKGRFDMQVSVGQSFLVYSECVFDSGTGLKSAIEFETAMENAGDNRPFFGYYCCAFDNRSQGYGLVQRKVQLLEAGYMAPRAT